ncbi:MAG: methylenetetrahydrofolate reductase [Acidobacteria bacterium]|nr:methylenetetrahydrofolate reductase [Acidobacteriota bacterium]
MTSETNNFARVLNSGRLVVTAECLPPRGADAVFVKDFSKKLPANLDAVVVADNPDAVRSSSFSTASLLKRQGRRNVIMAMTTRDRNRIALMSDALGAAALDIPAILCVAGNHQSISICPQAAAANDLDPVQLIHALKDMILHGAGLGGDKLTKKPGFLVGAVAQPYLRPMELNLLYIRKKISAGADFLLTQAVFDFEGFELWMEALRESGLDKRAAVIPCVMPIADLEKARELKRTGIYGPIPDAVLARIDGAADAAAEGVAIASEMAAKLKSMPEVRGIHILSGDVPEIVAAVIEQAGIGAGNPVRVP